MNDRKNKKIKYLDIVWCENEYMDKWSGLGLICALPIMLRYMLVVFLQGQDIIIYMIDVW